MPLSARLSASKVRKQEAARFKATKEILPQQPSEVATGRGELPGASIQDIDAIPETQPTIIVYSAAEIPEAYLAIRDKLRNPDKKRNSPVERYVDGSVDGIPRDPVGQDRSVWTDGDGVDQREDDGSVSIGEQQAYMLIHEGEETIVNGIETSQYCIGSITWPKPGPFPQFNGVDRPINVRCSSDFLGALWLSSKEGLNELYPGDFGRDGFPFADIIHSGAAFRPRIEFTDYHLPEPNSPDTRIAYIEDTDVIILGGTTFNASSITDEQYANFHLYFINITGRSRSELVSVYEEPEQKRRLRYKEPWFKPLGLPQGLFMRACGETSRTMNRINEWQPPAIFPVSRQERIAVINNLPTRGYDPTVPTYEVLSHAHLSASMTEAAYQRLKRTLIPRSETLRLLVRKLDPVGNALAILAENVNAEVGRDLDAARLIVEVQKVLTYEANYSMNLNQELNFIFDNIPKASNILSSLPADTIPSLSKAFDENVATIIENIMPDSTGGAQHLFYQREHWRTLQQSPVSENESGVKPKPLPKPKTMAHNNLPSDSHLILFEAISQDFARKRIRDIREAPNNIEAPKKKEIADFATQFRVSGKRKTMRTTPVSLGKERRISKSQDVTDARVYRQGGLESLVITAGVNEDGEELYWQMTSPGNSYKKQYLRTAVSKFGLRKERLGEGKANYALIEDYVRANQLHNYSLATQYGTLVPYSQLRYYDPKVYKRGEARDVFEEDDHPGLSVRRTREAIANGQVPIVANPEPDGRAPGVSKAKGLIAEEEEAVEGQYEEVEGEAVEKATTKRISGRTYLILKKPHLGASVVGPEVQRYAARNVTLSTPQGAEDNANSSNKSEVEDPDSSTNS